MTLPGRRVKVHLTPDAHPAASFRKPAGDIWEGEPLIILPRVKLVRNFSPQLLHTWLLSLCNCELSSFSKGNATSVLVVSVSLNIFSSSIS